jgi:hypothetical protein
MPDWRTTSRRTPAGIGGAEAGGNRVGVLGPHKVGMNRYQFADGLLELLNSQLVGVNW